jgi:hypothetical protein
MQEDEGRAGHLHELLDVALQLRGSRAASDFRAHVQQRSTAVHAILHVKL